MSDETLGSRFTSADQSPGLTLWQVTNRWQGVMRAALAPHDLTHVQYVLIACLVWMHAADPRRQITQTDLAQAAATDPMMTSQVLRTLESKGLIDRTPHPTDRRARVLIPTKRGTSIAQRATLDVEAADAGFFAPVEDLARLTADLCELVRETQRSP